MNKRIFTILMIVLIFMLVYVLFTGDTLVKVQNIVKKKGPISHKIKTSGFSFYYSMWYNINSRPNNLELVSVSDNYDIFHSILTDNQLKFDYSGFEFEKKGNKGKYQDKISEQNLGGINVGNYHIDVFNMDSNQTVKIPTNGWNNLIVSHSDEYIDVYINGELVKTIALDYKLQFPPDNIMFGTNKTESKFRGKMANLKYGEGTLSTTQAHKIYMEGLGQNPVKQFFDKYRLKVSVSNKGNEYGALEL